jgi:HEAT repeat protein
MLRHVSVSFALALALVVPAAAQQPRVTNGRIVTQPSAAGLDRSFRALVAAQSDPAWIGYAVPAAKDMGNNCCVDGSSWGRCGLEPGNRNQTTVQQQSRGPVQLEGAGTLVVLYRVEEKAVAKIRSYSLDCELDAGGRTILWYDGVKPSDSVELLSTFVSRNTNRNDRLSSSALAAVALHGDAAATPALIRFARQDPSTKVRGDALFWLAQKAGEKAVGEITSAIDQDPDTEVKRRAVFALSQLPKDEGVPLLINVARTNKNPAVRKQAMFWLGQSRDPRALEFFAEILGK